MIGPAALLLTTTQTTCVYASHDTELYMCPKELLIEALNEFPDIHRRLHRQALHEQAEVDAASAGTPVSDAPRAPFLRRSSSMYSEQSLEPPEGYDRTDSPPPEKEALRVPGFVAGKGGRPVQVKGGRPIIQRH